MSTDEPIGYDGFGAPVYEWQVGVRTGRITGRARQERNARILAESDVCHICGQRGADAVDHVIALAQGGTEERTNLAPAHHDVPPFCNRIKSDKAYAPIVRRSGSLKHPGTPPPTP